MKHTIKVPATSANIGPGFDCLGLALQLYNTFTIEQADQFSMTIEGEGKADIPTDESNLVYQTFLRACDEMGQELPNVAITQHNEIPMARGLGSSANAVVGGILCALAVGGKEWSKEQVLTLATEIEGHPDNVAPCIYGGFTVSICEKNVSRCISLPIDESLCPVAIIPGFELNTKQSRAALPKSLSYANAVYNIGHTAYIVAAMAKGEYNLLLDGVKDKMHQPYRASFIPLYADIMHKCYELESAAYLSGAGPTIMALMHRENAPFFIGEINSMLNGSWRVMQLGVDNNGAVIE